jgi:DNA-binding transcriptional ArsR family regulator
MSARGDRPVDRMDWREFDLTRAPNAEAPQRPRRPGMSDGAQRMDPPDLPGGAPSARQLPDRAAVDAAIEVLDGLVAAAGGTAGADALEVLKRALAVERPALDWRQIATLKQGHPLKVAILMLLAASPEPLSPRTLAERLDMPVENTAYHVRTLHEKELIRLARKRPVRGTVEHFYALLTTAVATTTARTERHGEQRG